MILNKKRFLFLTGLILIAAVSRLMPHPFNFTAIGAIALFGGASFQNRSSAIAVPLIAMFLTDLLIGFHSNMWAVYLSFIIIAFLGTTLRDSKNVKGIIGRSLLGSILFFVITNFAVWLGSIEYPQTIAGLAACYAAALPFFENSVFGNLALNTVMGDLFFNGVLFSALALAESKLPELQRVKV